MNYKIILDTQSLSIDADRYIHLLHYYHPYFIPSHLHSLSVKTQSNK